MFFTGNKDADRIILMNLPDKELLQICSINKYGKELCNDTFFMNYLIKNYPEILKWKRNAVSYKTHYLSSMYYIDEMKSKYNFDYKIGDPKYYYITLYNLNVVKTRPNKDEPGDYEYFLYLASKHGNLDLVQRIIDMADEEDQDIDLNIGLNGAAFYFNKNLIEFYLSEIDEPDWEKSLLNACNGRNIESIDFFSSQVENVDWNHCLAAAAKGDAIDTNRDPFSQKFLDYFNEKGATDYNRALSGAILGNNLNLMNFFYGKMKEKNIEINYNLALEASVVVDNLKWVTFFSQKANEINIPFLIAVKYNHFDIIKFLISKGANRFKKAIKIAKEEGHTFLVNYLENKYQGKF